ncbi:hypothetical protein F8388_000492 [Cannabis sativa]|uniref:Uncharacterized protein n=1 Tax=Cannabis sativa TaxID=3483 RepID=A0A7J6HHR6_CANSA|nr:hypothetical protein F8388_000492 [Cannabis sativa]KAF4394089.1 hypothetical protein G4B88_026058 [Cannabis sativa]
MAIKARPKPRCSSRSLFSKFWSSMQHSTAIPALLPLPVCQFGPQSNASRGLKRGIAEEGNLTELEKVLYLLTNEQSILYLKHVRDYTNGLRTLAHTSAITTVDWHPTLPIFLSGSADNSVRFLLHLHCSNSLSDDGVHTTIEKMVIRTITDPPYQSKFAIFQSTRSCFSYIFTQLWLEATCKDGSTAFKESISPQMVTS